MIESRSGPQPRAALSTLADILIPPTKHNPSASQADPEGVWVTHVLQVRPDLVQVVARAVMKASNATTAADIDRALADDPEAFAALTLVVAGAYYMNPEVRRQLGYPGQVAQSPATHWAYGTDELIERVKARGELYRTASEQKGGD